MFEVRQIIFSSVGPIAMFLALEAYQRDPRASDLPPAQRDIHWGKGDSPTDIHGGHKIARIRGGTISELEHDSMYQRSDGEAVADCGTAARNEGKAASMPYKEAWSKRWRKIQTNSFGKRGESCERKILLMHD
jgi:hypothetical protein